MKILSILLFVLVSASAIGQNQPKSGVYNLADVYFDTMVAQYFNGPSAAFTSFIVSAITLPKETISFGTTEREELFIVKEGMIQFTLGNKRKIIGPGGIAHIMPGDSRGYEVIGRKAFIYSIQFVSASPDAERGENNGGSFVIDWNDVEKKKSEKGWHRQFYNRPTTMVNKFEMHVTTLNAGISSHAPHTHPEEEIIILLRGKASMEIDGKKSNVFPGGLIYLASGVSHAITNTGKEECEYFAFQWK